MKEIKITYTDEYICDNEEEYMRECLRRIVRYNGINFGTGSYANERNAAVKLCAEEQIPEKLMVTFIIGNILSKNGVGDITIKTYNNDTFLQLNLYETRRWKDVYDSLRKIKRIDII